jgi:eukaryotic-like serine/threonine-protein kinase
VLDRMTDKDLAHRYADVPSLVADLEDALALEAARQGTSTGEATAVIRTLPARARRRLPFRMRHSLPVLALIGLAAVAVVIVIIVSGDVPKRVERGTGSGRLEQSTPTGTKVVSVPRGSAHDYDPLGDDEEHSEEVARVVDRDDGTAWSTESYQDALEGAGKKGVGIYVDAKPKVAAVSMQIDTPNPGFRVTIYAAPPGPVPKTVPEGWTKVGGGTVSNGDKRLKLDTGETEYRYYLVWITKRASDAEVSEIRLFQEVAASALIGAGGVQGAYPGRALNSKAGEGGERSRRFGRVGLPRSGGAPGLPTSRAVQGHRQLRA